MPMLEEETGHDQLAVREPGTENKQRRRMLVALVLLLVALAVVLFKDRQFWFPTTAAVAPDSADETTVSSTQKSIEGAGPAHPSAPPLTAKAKPRTSAPSGGNGAVENLAPGITATDRAVLPPLEVEVIAGGQRRTLQPKNNTVRVDMQSEGPVTMASSTTPLPPRSADTTQPAAHTVAPVPEARVERRAVVAREAAPKAAASAPRERVSLSADTAQVVSQPVEPSYPLLARQMKVQGSVVLQALIGRDGNIQDLRVLSGPAILSSAAMEAVKQWHFRPYFQSGQPVETAARITVNFTISTS